MTAGERADDQFQQRPNGDEGEASIPHRVLQFVAQQLVDHPEDVSVTLVSEERSSTLELRVHPDDLGKVIGKRGRTAKALRTLVKAAADGDPQVNVEIVD